MEENLNFVLKLSLEEMALRKVVVNLWNENDVIAMIKNFETDDFWYGNESRIRDSTEWRENVEKYVEHKASTLILPESLKKRMMPIVGIIGCKILSWKIIHKTFEPCLLERLSWSSSGVIDYKTTAEKIVSLETLDVMNRYKLACFHCLEDHIRVIWRKLPEENKRGFYNKLASLFHTRRIPLEIYWAFVLKGEESDLDDICLENEMNVSSFNQYAFLSSACQGNKAATEYFFQKLRREERNLLKGVSLIMTNRSPQNIFLVDFPMENLSDILFHLINKMPLNEKMQILQTQPGGVLRCLMVWPWQDILLDTADFIWTFLPESEYYTVMCSICNIFPNTAYNFSKLFQEFFLRSPINFKKVFIHSLDEFEFFWDAIPDTILSIIRDADVEDRKKFVSSFGFLKHLISLIEIDDCQTVESYLREAKLSNDDKEIVKEAFEDYFFHYEDYFFYYEDYISSKERLFHLVYETSMNS